MTWLLLRKLLGRGIKRVQPEWHVQEVASGEAALTLAASHHFDLIFVDQYMASMEKQLLGTETVAALRSKGCHARRCGLSANDVETAFLNAGADFFILKPIPASKEGLVGSRTSSCCVWRATVEAQGDCCSWNDDGLEAKRRDFSSGMSLLLGVVPDANDADARADLAVVALDIWLLYIDINLSMS
jgi:CheY-like chemotaxis protein